MTYLDTYFKKDVFLDSLSKVSDGICEDNCKSYIYFDNFKEPCNCDHITKGLNSLSSVDSLLINKNEAHIILVEFKDMESIGDFNAIKQWYQDKSCSIKIKIPDSILLLGTFLQKNGYSFDEFFSIKKSFFYVYKHEDISSKRKINHHLKYQFNKYNFLLKNTKTIESQSYIKFLEENNL